MSTVRDSEGNILNQQPNYVARHKYTGKDADYIDWFDHNPRPEEKPIEIVRTVEDGVPVVKMTEADLQSLLAETAVAGIEIGKQQAEQPTVEIVNNGDGTSTMTPSAADLDAVASEQKIAQETSEIVNPAEPVVDQPSEVSQGEPTPAIE